jgi:four helix bundle protein
MEKLKIGSDIAERLDRLGATILEIVGLLPTDATTRNLIPQLVRAGTSAGANYEEARGAESRADFIHKLGVALKEMRETLYWLRLVEATSLVDSKLTTHAVSEATQLAAILAASVRTARNNARASANRPSGV